MGGKISSAVSVSGGDISEAVKIEMKDGLFFCKYQKGQSGYAMLKAEKEGLEAISATGCVRTPEVLSLGQLDNGGYLVLEYIESRPPSEKDMAIFGEQLAQLHSTNDTDFGWDSDNFIGSLPQPNARRKDWAAFYALQRLIPQFRMARNKGLLETKDIPGETSLEARLRDLCSPSPPSLIHGDLWGGNYMISLNGEACLIDPSASYSHPGMDLAMSRLFGGFSLSFYRAYESESQNEMPDREEIELYQLYYLLVHLNLFGATYAASVRNILRRYF